MSTSKVILVTGGSSGLGQAMCVRLAAAGHTVVGTARRPEGTPNGYTLQAMDLTSEASVQQAVDAVIAKHSRIDVLINNAGQGIQGPAEDTPVDLAQQLFDANFFGLHRVCRAVLPGMRTRKSGLIINVSSIAANFGLPYRAFYSASKAAVDRYSEALSIELKPFNVKVVVVQPGEFNTAIANNRLRPAVIGPDYAKGYERAMNVLSSSMHYSRDPDELAVVVARIVADPSPALVYRVAQGVQKLSVLLKKLLPGRRFERMVGKHYE
ncbi:MAG TPA: SDR family oxidoreductase [Flavobacteriales bacterium]|jgi:NAD(P)-dependent dehydrogenase (short-subunit alcohol dehydrogenase family)|nr:SDR family oxidoreductase [Flavobacteriales bacterium]